MGRLILAGAAWDATAGAFVGGKVVRLETDGSWSEIHDPAVTGAWYLREYIDVTSIPRLFYISSPGGTASRPFRGSLYRSEDEGDTWADKSPPLGYVCGVSHGAGDRLWAITDVRQNPGQTTAGGPSYIYYSDDWGDTWVLSYTIPEVYAGRYYPLFNIAAHPTDSNKVVVEGTEMVGWDTRMWRTTDGGGSWSAAFDPVFPVGVDNVGGIMSLSLEYVSDGSLIYQSRASAGSAIYYVFRSVDDGANFSTYYSEGGFAGNDGMYFWKGCPGGYQWFLSDLKIWRGPDDWSAPPTGYGASGMAPFTASEYFKGITCHDGTNLNLGVHDGVPDPGCCSPPGVYTRPVDLSSGWVKHTSWDAMDGDLGYRVYPWPGGIAGATVVVPVTPPPDRHEIPCEEEGAAGDTDPQCIPLMSWEISVDGRNFFTQSRAQGMGMNNPGQDYVAELPDPEIWAPSSAKYGEEGGSYNVHRQLIVNDYGVNEADELSNLANAYLTAPEKKWKGITTIRFNIGGIPRAGPTAPTPGKILQAGDEIEFGCGSEIYCGIAEGEWIVDEVRYSFPKGITTVLASRRPAAQAVRTRGTSGNIRNLGETIANEFGVWESPWFSVEDTEFFMNPNAHDADRFYGTFKMEHYLGVIPRTYLVLAAKQKIYDWYDNDAVIAAQPLEVPRQFLDISQVQGVGYNIVVLDEIQAVFHLWRYLFYDSLDGRWVPPEDRFLKIWLIV